MRAVTTNSGYGTYDGTYSVYNRKNHSVPTKRTSGKRIQKKARRLRSHVAMLLVTVFMIAGFLMVNSVLTYAQDEPSDMTQSKYYKSITIENGDTLWELAEEYLPDDCESVEEYIRELKAINNLEGDMIIAGHTLVIAYS